VSRGAGRDARKFRRSAAARWTGWPSEDAGFLELRRTGCLVGVRQRSRGNDRGLVLRHGPARGDIHRRRAAGVGRFWPVGWTRAACSRQTAILRGRYHRRTWRSCGAASSASAKVAPRGSFTRRTSSSSTCRTHPGVRCSLHAEVVADRAVRGLLLIVQSGRPVRACDTLACASKGDRSRLETPTRRARLIRLHETRTRFHAATTRNFLREGVSPPAPAP
jgi:hypothetical protein